MKTDLERVSLFLFAGDISRELKTVFSRCENYEKTTVSQFHFNTAKWYNNDNDKKEE